MICDSGGPLYLIGLRLCALEAHDVQIPCQLSMSVPVAGGHLELPELLIAGRGSSSVVK
jgi:hypothetical protein